MICRIWKGFATSSNADAYESIVRGQVIPGIEKRQIHGFLQIDLMRRDTSGGSEFQTIMWFENLQAIIDFVGEDFEVSHVPPEAVAVLSSFDDHATHFEVLDRRPQ